MAVRLRLQRRGRSKAPFYHIVVADSRSPRDGRFIEKIGTYNPLTVPATIVLDRDRAYDWLMKGAQPTDTVNAILRFKGVLFRKHLMEGVKKGALTEEQATEKLATWIETKEGRIEARKTATAEEKRKFAETVDGKPKVKAKPAPEPEPVAEEAAAEEGAEMSAPVAEEETAPAVEAAAEETAPEAPAAEETAAEEVPAAEPVAEAPAEEAAPAAEETEAAPAAEEEA